VGLVCKPLLRLRPPGLTYREGNASVDATCPGAPGRRPPRGDSTPCRPPGAGVAATTDLPGTPAVRESRACARCRQTRERGSARAQTVLPPIATASARRWP